MNWWNKDGACCHSGGFAWLNLIWVIIHTLKCRFLILCRYIIIWIRWHFNQLTISGLLYVNFENSYQFDWFLQLSAYFEKYCKIIIKSLGSKQLLPSFLFQWWKPLSSVSTKHIKFYSDICKLTLFFYCREIISLKEKIKPLSQL